MEEIKENIKVYIRQRPPKPGDPMENSTMIGKSIVRKDGGTVAVSGIQSVAANGQSCNYFSGISHANHKFVMDRIFSGEAGQHDVYDTVARPIVDSCLKGYAGLVLAYGPTGSGKTYTMRGPQGGELRGIMPRCIEQILSANSHGTMEIWASYLQIYCEQISDLLRDNIQDIQAIDMTNPNIHQHYHGDANLNLRMKPDGSGVFVEGLMRYRIASVDDLFDVLERGDQYRSVAATNVNEFSSRSHAVLMLSIMIPEETLDAQTGTISVDDRVMREGQLMLVDLAGSERAHASEGKNYLRLEEAKAINLSLSALGNVMNALAESKTHVPYRDSKLTRLLQNCLGGTARTAIVVNVVPGEDPTGETLNALRFANRASKVKVVAKISKHRNFEILYKEALQKIKELEHFKEHALQLSGVQEEMHEKENLIDKLKLEIQMHKVQINQLQRENDYLKKANANNANTLNNNQVSDTAASINNNNNINNSNYNNNINHASDTANPLLSRTASATASSLLPPTVPTEEVVTISLLSQQQPQPSSQSQSEVEAISRSMKQKATDLKYKRLTQQVIDAEQALKEERERHLRTVQELRALHDQNETHESYFNKRIDELLQELTERQNLLDEHQQVLQNERDEKQVLEQEIASLKAKLVGTVDKEQVAIMENLFQETIERMNQRVQNLELQAFQQQQQFYQEQQLHLQEKHQWMEQQQQIKANNNGNSSKSSALKPNATATGKASSFNNASSTANNTTSVKKTSSTYSFWTPEGANALRQQQLQQQKDKDKDKDSSFRLNHTHNHTNQATIGSSSFASHGSSSNLSEDSSSGPNHQVGQFSNKQHVRIEPGGRLRPNSSGNSNSNNTNNNHNNSNNGRMSNGIAGAHPGNLNLDPHNHSNSNNNLRASLSAPKTLHSLQLSPDKPSLDQQGHTSTGTPPRSASVTRRSLVVVDPVTGITTTTTTTTNHSVAPSSEAEKANMLSLMPRTSSFRMVTPATSLTATAAGVNANGNVNVNVNVNGGNVNKVTSLHHNHHHPPSSSSASGSVSSDTDLLLQAGVNNNSSDINSQPPNTGSGAYESY